MSIRASFSRRGPHSSRCRHFGIRTFMLPLACLVMLSAGTPADGAQLSGYFRHSSVDGWINYAESFQSAETGPLSDTAQLPAIFGQYRVDYGRISAYSRNDGLTDHPAESQFRGTNAGTSARFTDGVTVTAPGMPLGSPGTMQVRIDVTGWMSATGFGSASYILDFSNAVGGGQIYGTLYGSAMGLGSNIIGDGFGSYVRELPIIFGYQLPLSIGVSADAAAPSISTGNFGSGVSDFFNTFAWGGVLGVFDANGAPLDVFTIVSESGYDYATVQPEVVPLPATVWMLLAGVGWLVRRAVRRAPK